MRRSIRLWTCIILALAASRSLGQVPIPTVGLWFGGEGNWADPTQWTMIPPSIEVPPYYIILYPDNNIFILRPCSVIIDSTDALAHLNNPVSINDLTVTHGTLQLGGAGFLTVGIAGSVIGVVTNGDRIIVSDGGNINTFLGALLVTGGGVTQMDGGSIGGPVTALVSINSGHDVEGFGSVNGLVVDFAGNATGNYAGKNLVLDSVTQLFMSGQVTAQVGGRTVLRAGTGIDHSGDSLAKALSLVKFDNSSVDNSGKIQADQGMVHFDGGSLENSHLVEALNLDGHVFMDGLSITNHDTFRAFNNATFRIRNSTLGTVGLLQSQLNSVFTLETVQANGGLLQADASSMFTVEGPNSYMHDFTLEGLMRVKNGGYLNVYGAIDNHLGEINIESGGHVDFEYLTNATLTGGTVSGTGTISKEYHHSLTLDATAGMHFQDFDMTVYPGGFLKLDGHLTNDATIRMYHDGVITPANTYLQIEGAGLIDGSGRILFEQGATKNQIIAASPGSTLTNGPDHTIASDGAGTWGQIDLDLTNHGTVDADGGFVFVTSPNVRNDGVMQSSNGGLLDIGGNSIGNVLDNTDGFIRSLSNGDTRLTNLLVKDGTLDGESVIDIGGVTTLQSSEMHITGHVRVASQQVLLMQGQFTNDGLIESHSNAGFQSRIYLDGHVILDGTGSLAFSSSNENFLFPTGVNSGSLTQMASHTLTTMNPGSDAELPVKITNYGTVDADNGYLYLTNKANINRGLMEASNGGLLSIGIGNDTATLDNVGGTLRANAGSQVYLTNLTVIGGTIEGTGSVVPLSAIAPVIFDGSGIHLDANINLYTGTVLYLIGEIINDGDIRMHGDAFSTNLSMIDQLDLSGSGQVSFIGPYNNRINGNAGARLFNRAGHSFKTVGPNSQGVFDLNFTNDGLIEADDGSIYIQYVGSSHVNRGMIRSVNTGFMSLGDFYATAGLDNRDGTLFVDSTSGFVNSGVTIKGGHFDGGGYFTIQGLNTYDGSTASGPITVDANTYIGWAGALQLKGQVTNNGRMVIADDAVGGPASYVVPNGSVSLDGTGRIEFSSPYENGIVPPNNSPGHRLVQGPDHSIKAIGANTVASITANITNNGLIEVDDATLYWQSIDIVNRGTIRNINGGTMWFGDPHNSAVIDNQNGVISTDAISTTINSGITIRGGHLNGGGLFYIQGSAAYDGSTASGPMTLDAFTNVGYLGRLVVRGSIINNNRLLIADADFAGVPAAVVVEGPVSLTGSGSVQFGNLFDNLLVSGNAAAHLTVGAQQLITAPSGSAAHINLPMVLNGTLGADGGLMNIFQQFTNNGMVRATNGSFQQFFFPTNGAGGWLADGGTLYFHPGANPTTAGPINIRNGGVISYNGVNATGSDLLVDATSVFGAGGGVTHIQLTGDFAFAASDESLWSWSPGSVLHMNGGVSFTESSFDDWASLEIGGHDIGIDPPNHVGDPAGFVNSNFYIPNLVIGPGAHVYLADLLDNGHFGGPFGYNEALYVNTLTFSDANSLLNLNGLHLYYLNLSGSAAQILNTPVPEPSIGLIAFLIYPLVNLRHSRRSVAGSVL